MPLTISALAAWFFGVFFVISLIAWVLEVRFERLSRSNFDPHVPKWDRSARVWTDD